MWKKYGWFNSVNLVCLVICLHLPNASAEPVQEDQTLIDMALPIVATVGQVEFRECVASVQGRDRKGQCAWLEVPENPEVKNGKHIALFVFRLPAKRAAKTLADPVLLLSGGPGQAASETFLYADHVWPELAKHRDFYLVDQRGTGHSNPMRCAVLDDELSAYTDYDAELVKRLTKTCLSALPGDPRFYTTDVSVTDFERVRESLGVHQWNLLGVSYGTRVATHYMRQFPSSVRSVVLDSAVPPQHVLGTEIAIRSQEVLDTLYQRCDADPACAKRIPELKVEVKGLFEQLNQAPVTIKVENFRTGEIESMEFTRHHLITLVRMYLYNPQTLALLPPMLHEAADNQNYSPLARSAMSAAEAASGSIALGLHNSVMCTEEFPYFDMTSAEQAANLDTYMGMGLVQLMGDICSVWPKGEQPENMKDPIRSDIPTLIVSGEFDPITPPEYAHLTAQGLNNATVLLLKGQGHFVSGVGCVPNLVSNFVDGLNKSTLDQQCLQRIYSAPLFVNFNGAAP